MVSWRAGVLLLAALLALVVYAVVSGRTRPPASAPPFLPCPSVDTVYVKIAGQGRVVEMERATPRDAWQVILPRAAPADSDRATTITSSLQSLRVLNTIPRPEQTTDYGFAQPHAVVTCRVSDRASYNLSIGNQSFDSTGYYAQKTGDSRVYVISGVEVDTFDRALSDPPVRPSPSPTT